MLDAVCCRLDAAGEVALGDALGHFQGVPDRHADADDGAPGHQTTAGQRHQHEHRDHGKGPLAGGSRFGHRGGRRCTLQLHEVGDLGAQGGLCRAHLLGERHRCRHVVTVSPQLGCRLQLRQGLLAQRGHFGQQLAFLRGGVQAGQRLHKGRFGARIGGDGGLQVLQLLVDARHVGQQRDRARLDRHAVDLVQQVTRQIGAVVVDVHDLVHALAGARQLEGAQASQGHQQRQKEAEAGQQAARDRKRLDAVHRSVPGWWGRRSVSGRSLCQP
jgi:hypothetical protein